MKKALVTGGTKGIGLAITRALLSNEYSVIATYASDIENAKFVEKELSSDYKERLTIIRQALESKNDIDSLICKCKSQDQLSSGFDAIVLNAGCTDRTAWPQLKWEQWRHVLDVNLNAPANLLLTLDSYINENAAIVFISSDMSVFPHASSVPYTVSKSAINGLTKALVKEYAARRIRVNAILPGFVETPWQKEKPEDQRKRICDKVALHRFALPDEIAHVVLSVIKSTYMNGALVQVDGGYCYR